MWTMVARIKLCAIIYIFLNFICTVYSEDVCTKKGACVCEFPNGTGIDLTPSSGSTFYTAQMYHIKDSGIDYVLSTYYFHPCHDLLLNVPNLPPKDTCDQPLSICRHVSTMHLNNKTKDYNLDGGVYNKMGIINDTKFSEDGGSITYKNGPSSTKVLLVCAQTDDQLQVLSVVDPNRIELVFYSRNACIKQIEEFGRSFGSTLLIIFFSLVIFYLVLGVCIKKFLFGATGIEVIPDVTFWMDLPNLVKDGWVFALNGFKLPPRGPNPTTSPDPTSYDSI